MARITDYYQNISIPLSLMARCYYIQNLAQTKDNYPEDTFFFYIPQPSLVIIPEPSILYMDSG